MGIRSAEVWKSEKGHMTEIRCQVSGVRGKGLKGNDGRGDSEEKSI